MTVLLFVGSGRGLVSCGGGGSVGVVTRVAASLLLLLALVLVEGGVFLDLKGLWLPGKWSSLWLGVLVVAGVARSLLEMREIRLLWLVKSVLGREVAWGVLFVSKMRSFGWCGPVPSAEVN